MTGRLEAHKGPSLAAVIALPIRLLAFVADMMLSRRGLAVGFLLGAAGFALIPWLRPPLSRDIRGLELPLAVQTRPAAEELLYGARPRALDSVGALILGITAVGVVVVLLSPRRLALVAGVLLVGAVAANAAAALNHPVLTELLDFEWEERHHMVQVINQVPDQYATANATNNRVDERIVPVENERWPNPLRGWVYLHYGQWLILWAAMGLFLAQAGHLRRRLAMVGVWGVLAVAAACGVCSQRLYADYRWTEAVRLEAERDYDGCRQAMAQALQVLPELASMERTWMLAGKVDALEGRQTPPSTYYKAYQLRRHQERLRALALLSDLQASAAEGQRAVRYQAARLYIETGLEQFREDRLMAAQDAWRRAAVLVPGKTACAVGLALVQSQVDRLRPELAEREVAHLLSQLADRPVRADLLRILGHAHFEAGQLTEARRRFAQSAEAFSLPKTINYGAQKGLGGL
jgi:hypothetical protein